jgi:ATP-dependent RNA helicase DDX31/DBP7
MHPLQICPQLAFVFIFCSTHALQKLYQEHGALQPRDGPPRPPAAPQLPNDRQLKGYSLDPPKPPETSPRVSPSPVPTSRQVREDADGQKQSVSSPNVKRKQRPPPAAATRHEEPSKRVGRMRLQSRLAGNRESTPDQDDIKPLDGAVGEDGEDIMAAVNAALTRDRALQAELAASGKTYDLNGNEETWGRGYHDGEDDDDDMSEGEFDLHMHSGVVDFDANGSSYPMLRKDRKRAKRESSRDAAPGTKALAVRPGLLTHAGDEAVLANATVADATQGTSAKSRRAVASFRDLGISEALSSHLASFGFVVPTAVQRETVPILLSSKRDALVRAPTGSGKTLAYLAPILHDLASLQPRVSRMDGTLALIVAPTRELCLQVTDTLTLMTRRFVWIVPGAIYGGEHRGKEKARLRRGVSVLAASPGRLLDHLQNTSSFRTDKLRWLVLDEADRLLDLGFENKIKDILNLLNDRSGRRSEGSTDPQHDANEVYSPFEEHEANGLDAAHSAEEREHNHPSRRRKTVIECTEQIARRSVLLSATLHDNLGALASLSLREPLAVGFKYEVRGGRLDIKDVDNGNGNGHVTNSARRSNDMAAFELPTTLKQKFIEVPAKLRLVVLAALLKIKLQTRPDKSKMVVFFSSCDSVDFHHLVLSRGWATIDDRAPWLSVDAPLLKLHGDMPQGERTSTLLRFTKATAGVLLCTDVAARGLDFPAVTCIVQFDPPGAAEEYVHRVGRTARLGATGEALIFLMPSEKGYVEYLEARGIAVAEEKAGVSLDKALGMDARASSGMLPLERHRGAFSLQRQLMDAISGDGELRRSAETAFGSFVRAYATHSAELKAIFSMRNLHLGHIAHSFALQETPVSVGRSAGKDQARRKEKQRQYDGRKRGKPMENKFSMVTARGGGGYVLS